MSALPPDLHPAAGPVTAGPGPAGPPPAWYADPWQVAPWRWWDGTAWTSHVWPVSWSAPAAPVRRMRGALWPAIGWMLVSIAAGLAAAIPPGVVAMVAGGEDAAVTTTVVVFYPVMFLGFWLASRRLSRRYGTGDLRADFGWRRFRKADIGWGVLAGVAALVAQLVLGALLPQPGDDTYRDAVLGKDPGVVMLVAMGLAVVIGAPLFEELLFRGPIMRSLLDRFGVGVGLVLQGAVFALYHIVGDPRLAGLWYLAPLFVVGIIFGFAAQRTGRLATSQIAHCVMNVLAFVALLSTL